mgnify:FL=1
MSRKQLARSGGDLSALSGDDTGCTTLHVDMDSFFVSVELLDRPDLKGAEVIVGGRAGRGVVVSASYEARAYGVYAGMPMSRALAQCPSAVVIPPSRGLYSQYSARVFDILKTFTNEVHQVSVDEAYIDVASAVRRLGRPGVIAQSMRAQIREATGLAASIGVAHSRVVAKMASARAKPDGMLVVPRAQVAQFLHDMPVEAIPGVGGKTQDKLARYGITTIGQLAACSPDWLNARFGAHGKGLYASAHGEDSRDPNRVRDHSISAEHTFPADIFSIDELELELIRLADTVASRVRKEGKAARTVSLKYRTADFSTFTRSVTLTAPSDVASEFRDALLPALRTLHTRGTGVRLLGVRAADLNDLGEVGRQATLEDTDSGKRDSEIALDAVRSRFGSGAISRASLIRNNPDKTPDAPAHKTDYDSDTEL